jgi:ATP-dependent DNA ligase
MSDAPTEADVAYLLKAKKVVQSVLRDTTDDEDAPLREVIYRVARVDNPSDDERLFKELEAMQLEGMVAKRKDSVYAFTRSRLWLKIKTAAGRAEMKRRIDSWG